MGNICTSHHNDLSRDGRPMHNTENRRKPLWCMSIDKWDVDDVFEWLSTVDDGLLYELAIIFRTNRIRGRILDDLTESQLIDIGVTLGDRIHFKKVRTELFNHHSSHSNPISHVSSNFNHHSSHSNPCIPPHDPCLEMDDQLLAPHPYIKSSPQVHPVHWPNVHPRAPHAQYHTTCVPNDSLNYIEENQYAAVAYTDLLIEDSADLPMQTRSKPTLTRSSSAEEYKGRPPISAHHFNHSASNPTIINRRDSISPIAPQLAELLGIAKRLQHVMKLEVKTVHEIAEILAIESEDECIQIVQQLLDVKLLNRVIRTDSTDNTTEKVMYECNHGVHASLSKVYRTTTAANVSNKTIATSTHPLPSIHRAAPSFVDDRFHHMPMTVDSWNAYIRERTPDPQLQLTRNTDKI